MIHLRSLSTTARRSHRPHSIQDDTAPLTRYPWMSDWLIAEAIWTALEKMEVWRRAAVWSGASRIWGENVFLFFRSAMRIRIDQSPLFDSFRCSHPRYFGVFYDVYQIMDVHLVRRCGPSVRAQVYLSERCDVYSAWDFIVYP